MKYPVYAIRDEKVGFGAPRIYQNDEVAKRSFAYEVNLDGSPMAFAPKDYSLYMIGKFDIDSAAFESCIPQYISSGLDVYGVNK